MRLSLCFLSAILFFAAGCAAPIDLGTPSGKPEIVISQPAAQLRQEFVRSFVQDGWLVTRETPTQVSFDKPSNDMLTNVFLGSDYDRQPNYRITLSFLPARDRAGTHILADIAIITNPGSGFERRQDFNGSLAAKELQDGFEEIKRLAEARQ